MIEKIKAGDKLTVIKVNSFAATSINEIVIDSIQDGRAVFAVKRKKYYLTIDNSVLVLKGHNLGIKQGSWNNGAAWFIVNSNCNLGGLDRESMITLLKTNINSQFNQWENIYWFDGTSDKGDPIFVPRPVSENYLRYREQAEANNTKTADQINIDDFIYTYVKGAKHNNLIDMLKYHLTSHKGFSEELSLGKIMAIMEVSEEQFDSLRYMDSELELPNKGGRVSEDIAEERRDCHSYSEFECETFYSLLTLIRTPSGRAITVDKQEYDYMRYTGLLYHYKTSMNADCERVQEALRIEREEEQKEEQAKKDEAAQLEQAEIKRIEKEYNFLTVIADYRDQKTIGNNLRALLKMKFPATKFSVRKQSYNYYYVEWNDGPSVPQIEEIARLFINKRFDGMTNSSLSFTSPFIQRFGEIRQISPERHICDARKNEELALLNSELGKSYKIEDYVTERCEQAATLVYQRTYEKDFSPAVESNTATKPTSINLAFESINTQGLEIIDYSEKSFAIIGDTKPIKNLLSDLGGSFNSRLKCGAGWIFSKTKLNTVKQSLSII